MLHSLTLEQWIEQYRILREKNRALLKGAQPSLSRNPPLTSWSNLYIV